MVVVVVAVVVLLIPLFTSAIDTSSVFNTCLLAFTTLANNMLPPNSNNKAPIPIIAFTIRELYVLRNS